MARGGKRPGAGRKHGSQNKETKQLREMILAALDKEGGEVYLAKQAREKPAAFMQLLGKVLPMQVTGADGGPIKSEVKTIPESVESKISELLVSIAHTTADK